MNPPPQAAVPAPTNNDGHPLLTDEYITNFGQSCRKLHRDRLIDDTISLSETGYKNNFRDMRTRKKTRCAETLAIEILADAIVRGTIRKYRVSRINNNGMIYIECLYIIDLLKDQL